MFVAGLRSHTALTQAEQLRRIREHLVQHGKWGTLPERPHVFAAVRDVNWERYGLVDGWRELADVVHYDWRHSFDQYHPQWHSVHKNAFNDALLEQVAQEHTQRRLDIFFSYLSGRWVFPDTIRKIASMGIITVNISFDDTEKFWGVAEESGFAGNGDIAPAFDFCVTCQSSGDVGKYLSVKANPLFLPPAASIPPATPQTDKRARVVTFVGQCYGVRPAVVEQLRENGVEVTTLGRGWPSGEVPRAKMEEALSTSLINLGFGYIGGSTRAVGLKGRDFEVPLAGGLYITTYNTDLESAFQIGSEIVCYRSPRELLALIRWYLQHPEEAVEIGAAGRQRVLTEHLWPYRFRTVLQAAGWGQ